MPSAPRQHVDVAYVARVAFEGHLAREQVREKLAAVEMETRPAPRVGVLVDCTAMKGYDLDARTAFVEWHSLMGPRLTGVAIITENPFYHMVIRAMSLASRVEMRSFSTVEAGEQWLRGRGARSVVSR